MGISYKLLSGHTFGIQLNRNLKFVKDDSCIARLNTTFKCQRCAECCEYEIFPSEQDTLRLANFSPHCRSLVQYDETRKVYSTLKAESEGHTLEARCAFLDGKNCTVYAARPSICRAYPFFPIAKRDLDSLKITFPADAICVLDPNTKIQYLVFYDSECPGIGKGGLVNWNNVVQLSFEG
jgi:Fe-S-cluster containining protein